MATSLREAGEADLDRLVDIHAAAFPDPRGREVRARNFVHNALGSLKDLHVLVDAGTIVAHAFLFPLEAWFGGVHVRVGGIASAGVAPEARGRGYGSRLIERLHEVAQRRGDAITVLYPFRQGFYDRLGYSLVSSYRRLRFAPRAIPWAPELPTRAASGTDREALAACWDAAGVRRTGSVVRTRRAWDQRLLDERRHWMVAHDATGAVHGYVAWTLAQPEPHAQTTLVVRDLAARTGAAARSLWGLVGAQRDQVAEVQVDVAEDDPLDRALLDADRARFGDAKVEHVLGEVAAGPMVRLLDATQALEARGWLADGRVVVAAGDETLELVARDGHAVVARTEGEPMIRLTPHTLAAIAFGGLRASDASRLGRATARDDSSLALADALFALPPYFSPDPF